MFNPMSRFLAVIVLSLWFSPMAQASNIALLTGEHIEGQIIQQSDLQVVMDVQGNTETYYLGEIASIDGKKVEIHPVNKEETAAAQVTRPAVPSAKAPLVIKPSEPKVSAPAAINETTLIPVMKIPPIQRAPSTPDPEKLEVLVHRIHDMTGMMLDMSKNVIPTPDGGIIVVTPDKITKYDKDLKVIKVINFDTPPNSNP